MPEEMKRTEVGFGGGQVMSVRITNGTLGELRRAVGRGEGWHEVTTDDETLVINLNTVIFLRVADRSHSIGFAGS